MDKTKDRTNYWSRSENYDIGGEAEEHVKGPGIAFLRQHLRPRPLLVDFGCWGGRHLWLLRELAGSGGRVVGTDGPWAWERLAETRDLVNATPGLNAEIQQQRLENLDAFETESVDGALCWRVLHNLTEPGALEMALRELNRVLARGSPLLVAVRAVQPDMQKKEEETFPLPQLMRTRPGSDAGEREDFYFTREAVKTVFTQWGFQVCHIEDTPGSEMWQGTRLDHLYLAVHLLRR